MQVLVIDTLPQEVPARLVDLFEPFTGPSGLARQSFDFCDRCFDVIQNCGILGAGNPPFLCPGGNQRVPIYFLSAAPILNKWLAKSRSGAEFAWCVHIVHTLFTSEKQISQGSWKLSLKEHQIRKEVSKRFWSPLKLVVLILNLTVAQDSGGKSHCRPCRAQVCRNTLVNLDVQIINDNLETTLNT